MSPNKKVETSAEKYKPGVEIITDTSTMKPTIWILAETRDGRNVILGGKYALVVQALSNGYNTYNEIRKSIGMSKSMLSKILSELQKKGFLERHDVEIGDLREKPYSLLLRICKCYPDGDLSFGIVY